MCACVFADMVRDDWEGVFKGCDRTATPHARFTISIPKLPTVFTGSGDLTAALLLANSDAFPHSFVTACERTIATVQAVCKRTMDFYSKCVAELEAAKADASGARRWIIDAATSSSGQMGAVVPVFGELRLVQSKADIENPMVPSHLKAKSALH